MKNERKKKIKAKLSAIKELARNVKHAENGYTFTVLGKPCKMSLKASCEVYKKELILKANCDLMVDGVLWLGVSYSDTLKCGLFEYSQDMIKLYAHLQSLSEDEKLKHRADINTFIDSLVQ